MTTDLTVEQSWRGPFWLPGQPDRDHRRVLTYDPNNGITLSLVNGFGDGRWAQPSAARPQSARLLFRPVSTQP